MHMQVEEIHSVTVFTVWKPVSEYEEEATQDGRIVEVHEAR